MSYCAPVGIMRCPQLMFWQHHLSHMLLTIFKFKSGSFLLFPHLYTSSKKGHSEKMLALILMICHQSYWHTLQSRRSIHPPLEKLRTNRGSAVRVSSHQSRADGVSVSRAAEGLLHAFMWTFTYLTQCLKVAVLSSHVTVRRSFCWGCQNYREQISQFTPRHMAEASLTFTRQAWT